MEDFGVYWIEGVCGNSVEILWEFPKVFLWVWDVYGNWNPILTAARCSLYRHESRVASVYISLCISLTTVFRQVVFV